MADDVLDIPAPPSISASAQDGTFPAPPSVQQTIPIPRELKGQIVLPGVEVDAKALPPSETSATPEGRQKIAPQLPQAPSNTFRMPTSDEWRQAQDVALQNIARSIPGVSGIENTVNTFKNPNAGILQKTESVLGAGLGAMMTGTPGGAGFNVGTKLADEAIPGASQITRPTYYGAKWIAGKLGKPLSSEAESAANINDIIINGLVIHGISEATAQAIAGRAVEGKPTIADKNIIKQASDSIDEAAKTSQGTTTPPTITVVPKNPHNQLFLKGIEAEFADAYKKREPFDINKYFTPQLADQFQDDPNATQRLQDLKKSADAYNTIIEEPHKSEHVIIALENSRNGVGDEQPPQINSITQPEKSFPPPPNVKQTPPIDFTKVTDDELTNQSQMLENLKKSLPPNDPKFSWIKDRQNAIEEEQLSRQPATNKAEADYAATIPRNFMEQKLIRSGEDKGFLSALDQTEIYQLFKQKGLDIPDRSTEALTAAPPSILKKWVEEGEITQKQMDNALAVGRDIPNEKFVEELRQKGKIAKQPIKDKSGMLASSIIPGLSPEDTQKLSDAATAQLKKATSKIKTFIQESGKDVLPQNDLADDLYRLQTNNTADRIRAVHLIESLDVKPADDKAVYHYSENNKERITPEQKAYYDQNIKPLKDEVERIKAKVNDTVPTDTENFNTRIVTDKGNALDRIIKGTKEALQQGNPLSQKAGFLKKRTMKALEDAAGNREVISIKGGNVVKWVDNQPEQIGKLDFKSREELLDEELKPIDSKIKKLNDEHSILGSTKKIGEASLNRILKINDELEELRTQRDDTLDKYDPAKLDDKIFIDKNGKQWKMTDATTKEIEANTKLKYYKSALATNLLAYTKARQIERAYDFMESFKNTQGFADIAKKFGDPTTPEGWKPTNLQNFSGYSFDPKVADVLDRFHDDLQRGKNPAGVLTAVNNFLRTSIFFNPLIHVPNIAVHWLVNRGASAFVSPRAYKRLFKTGLRAIDAVIHQNPDYIEMLEHGAPLQYRNGENISKLLMDKIGMEVQEKPSVLKELSNIFGYANPSKLIKAIYDFSGKATWATNDVATMQAIYEEMSHGKTMDEAIKDVGKHVPNYRVPARVLNSTKVSSFLRNPNLTMFGAYHYGALRSYWEMAKSIINPLEGKERTEAIDKMAMLGLSLFVIYPQLDNLAQKMTGSQSAYFRRAGAATLPQNLYNYSKGEKDLSDVLFSVVTPAVFTKELAQLSTNMDFHTGKEIYKSHDLIRHPLSFAREIGPSLKQTIAPLGAYERIASGKTNLPAYLESMVGIQRRNAKADFFQRLKEAGIKPQTVLQHH